jgi:hypothetical protein
MWYDAVEALEAMGSVVGKNSMLHVDVWSYSKISVSRRRVEYLFVETCLLWRMVLVNV